MNTAINLTPIIQALIGLLATLITCRLVPWIKAKTTNEQQSALAAAIKIAVYAAEQIFGNGHGADKMDYALRYLRDKGFDVDSREIEAAVAEYLNYVKVEYFSETIGQPNKEVGDGE